MGRKSPIINVMYKAADRAARGLLRDFGEVEQLQVSKKGPGDFVSKADLKSEQTIRAELEKAKPEYGFLMEESGETKGADAEHTWIVDPLDGTTNFLHGIPHWSITIALKKGHEIVCGITYDPCKDEMYWAEKGIGAFMNSKRLRVSGKTSLGDSLGLIGIPTFSHLGRDGFLKEIPVVTQHFAAISRLGSAALDLAYVAAGRAEGYWDRGPHTWDFATGSLLVREAGGFVSEIDGGKDYLNNRNILATNAALHDEIKGLLNPK